MVSDWVERAIAISWVVLGSDLLMEFRLVFDLVVWLGMLNGVTSWDQVPHPSRF